MESKNDDYKYIDGSIKIYNSRQYKYIKLIFKQEDSMQFYVISMILLFIE